MGKLDFGKWLEEERLVRGWSQRELARRMKVSGSHISNVEAGSTGVTADFCHKLARAFLTDVVDVLRMAGLIGNSIPNKPETTILDPDIQKVADLMANNPDQKELITRMAELLVHGRGNERVVLGRASPPKMTARKAEALA